MNEIPGLTIVEEFEPGIEDFFPSTTVGQEIYVRGVSVVLYEVADALEDHPIPVSDRRNVVALGWSELGRKVRELAVEARGRETGL